MSRILRRTWPLAAAFTLMLAMVPAAAHADGGYLTPEDPLLELDAALPSGAYVRAIISSGESVDGTLFEGLPDGIGIRPGPYRDTIDVYVAHEQTTVPFFGSADFVDASVTKWTLSTNGPGRGSVLVSAPTCAAQRMGETRIRITPVRRAFAPAERRSSECSDVFSPTELASKSAAPITSSPVTSSS